MKTIYEYKGYYTKKMYSNICNVWHGRVYETTPMIMFECDSEEDFEQAFHKAVDDHCIAGGANNEL